MANCVLGLGACGRTISLGGTDASVDLGSERPSCVRVPAFRDLDGDGYGAAPVGDLCDSEFQPGVRNGVSPTSGDCDDQTPFAFPGLRESCDGFDNDCDGTVDESAGEACDLVPHLSTLVDPLPQESGLLVEAAASFGSNLVALGRPTSVTVDTIGRAGQGDVLIFEREGNESWRIAQRIPNPMVGVVNELRFGSHVALSRNGDFLAVSAISDDHEGVGVLNQIPSTRLPNQGLGAVYLYRREENQYAFWRFLKPHADTDCGTFGRVVRFASSDDALVVGSYCTGDGEGAPPQIFLLERTSGEIVGPVTIASPTNASIGYGTSLSVSSNGLWIAVGDPFDTREGSGISSSIPEPARRHAFGAVYLQECVNYECEIRWIIQSTQPEIGAAFGLSVAFSPNEQVLAIGSPGASQAGIATGAVWMMDLRPSVPVFSGVLRPSQSEASARFGESLEFLTDTRVAVSAPASSAMAPGVHRANERGATVNAGAVFLFEYVDAVWSPRFSVRSLSPQVDSRFGSSLASRPNGLVIGSQALLAQTQWLQWQ